jgi:hypothetical protein
VRSIALGNSAVALPESPWLVFQNPAGLSGLTTLNAAAFFVPGQFGLVELKTIAAAVVIPTPFLHLGVGVEQFGFSLYKETGVSLSLAKKIDWGISGGITATGRHFFIQRYGTKQVLLLDVGLLAQIDERLRLGFSGRNVGSATIGLLKERLPMLLDLGLAFRPLKDLLLTCSLEKEMRFPAMIKGGVEHIIFEILALRAGFANNPQKFSGGVGIRYSSLEFGYAGYSHPFLGWTHQLEVAVCFDD